MLSCIALLQPFASALLLQGRPTALVGRACSTATVVATPTAAQRPSSPAAALGGRRRTMMMMAAPRSKLPTRRVGVYCGKCNTKLYKYAKGGKGSLVKCYVERIVEDFTEAPCTCPACGATFARETLVHGRPAFKIVGGKAYQKKS